MLHLPTQLAKIPQPYFRQDRSTPGRLVNFEYDTYDSFSYGQRDSRISKRAVVYLPYNYLPRKQYNVFYLMHGGWSDETTYLGTPTDPHPLKNVLDNAIAAGKIAPLIVVCPTYNNCSDQDSSDYELALRLTDNYHRELANDLVPAIESHFSTYAPDVTERGLVQSRNHRAFCGFSMGSVTTWHTFQYCLNYFRYFFPSSGALTNNGKLLARFVKEQGYGPQDFFIFAASGTADFAYTGFTAQIKAMAAEKAMFTVAPDEEVGNLYYLVAPGGTHSPANALEDFYNALIQVWKEN